MSCSMKSYLRSHLRQNVKSLLYVVAFAIALTFISSNANQCQEITYYDSIPGYYYSSELYTPVSILAILCAVLPVTEFAFFKKRRNLDCAYALPISRRDMGLVHYLSGLLLLVVPYTCSYLVNYLLLLRYPGMFDLAPLWGHYFLCLILGVSFYSVFVFVFNQANSTGDGIWFIVLWSFVFFLLQVTCFSVLERLFYEIRYEYDIYSYINPTMGIPWLALSGITSEYNEIVIKSGWGALENIWSEFGIVSMVILWLVLGVASAVGMYYTFGNRGAQKTEEMSDSWFGYRVMIPLYAVCGMISCASVEQWLIIEGIAFVGYVIYRKGFHLQKSDWLTLLLLIFFLFISG